jgi:hypothetical protein
MTAADDSVHCKCLQTYTHTERHAHTVGRVSALVAAADPRLQFSDPSTLARMSLLRVVINFVVTVIESL